MTKYVLISYRWEKDRPEEKWLLWLKRTLEQRGYHVTLSELHDIPKERNWVEDLQAIYGIADSRVYRVPHDPGCLTILSYVESLSRKKVEETVLLVAQVGGTISRTAPALESTKSVGFLKRTLGYSHTNNDQLSEDPTKLVVLYSSLGPLLSPQDTSKKLLSS